MLLVKIPWLLLMTPLVFGSKPLVPPSDWRWEQPAHIKEKDLTPGETKKVLGEARFLGGLKTKLCQVGLGINDCQNEIEDETFLDVLIRNPRSARDLETKTQESEKTIIRIPRRVKNEKKSRKRAKQRIKVRLENNYESKLTKTPATTAPRIITTTSPPTRSSKLLDNKLDSSPSKSSSSNPLTRFFGSGLDGLKGPAISPSFGVTFGSLPGSYGGYNPFGGSSIRNSNPLGLDVGPVSLNPFVGLKVSKLDGRPIITPSLDLLISPNAKGVHDIKQLKSKITGQPEYYDVPPPIHHHPGPIHTLPPNPAPFPPHHVPFSPPPQFAPQPIHHPTHIPQNIHVPQIHQGPGHLLPAQFHNRPPPSVVPVIHESRPTFQPSVEFDTGFVPSRQQEPQVHYHQHEHQHHHNHRHEGSTIPQNNVFSRPTHSRPTNTHFQSFGRTETDRNGQLSAASEIFREDLRPPSTNGPGRPLPIRGDSSVIFREPRTENFQSSRPSSASNFRETRNTANTKKFVFPAV